MNNDEPVTDDELDRWQEMCDAATPGPWIECRHLESVEADAACGCGYRGGIFGPEFDPSFMVCEMGSTVIPGEEGLEAPRYERPKEIANAQFIVCSRTALPRLIAEVRRLRAEREAIAADAVNRLKACQADCDAERFDADTAHRTADGILCDTLDRLGLQAVTAAYDDVDKWYA